MIETFNIQSEDDEIRVLRNIFKHRIGKEHLDIGDYLQNTFSDQYDFFEFSGVN